MQQFIAARLERVPFSSWHVRVLIIIGAIGFFVAFDSLAIAFVLPLLFRLWHVGPQLILPLIFAQFVGDLVGAVALGYVADRFGRVASLRWAVAIFSIFSLCCATAWSYGAFLAFRFLQGLGLGAINPLAAVYLVETSGSRFRGRMVLGFQAIFACASIVTGLVGFWIVPSFGWRSMFVIGALPVLLALWLGRLLPESPRWLENAARSDEADRVLSAMEAQIFNSDILPAFPPSNAQRSRIHNSAIETLLEMKYLRRTLFAWLAVFCASAVGYGLTAWLPTLYRTAYPLPLRRALDYSFIPIAVGACAMVICLFVIDLVPRRRLLSASFLAAGALLVALGLMFASVPFSEMATLASLAVVAISFASGALHLYVPEIYPTRSRALGAGLASVWSLIATQATPFMLSVLVAVADFHVALEFLAVAALASAGAIYLLAVETRGRALEDISP